MKPHSQTHATLAAAERFVAAMDGILAVVGMGIVTYLLWTAREPGADPHGLVHLGSFFMLGIAISFLTAHFAMRRRWHIRWLLQVASVSLLLYFFFGTW